MDFLRLRHQADDRVANVCQRGAAKRQRPRTEGPMCADALANNMVQVTLRDLEAWFNGTVQALAKAGVFGAKGDRDGQCHRSGDHDRV